MATGKAPMDFTTSDDGPDCRLQVFDQVFHVDSLILKTHSGFFRMFFDSPDKALSTFKGPYKYMWVTRVDDDGRGWNLVAGDNENGGIRNINTENYRLNPDSQEKAFETVLCAMYGRACDIQTPVWLETVFMVADYFLALPVLSNSLDRTLANVPNLSLGIPHAAPNLIKKATKLHHAALFRECLIWIIGPHKNPVFLSMPEDTPDNLKIKQLAEKVHGQVCVKIAQAEKTLLELCFSGPLGLPIANHRAWSANASLGYDGEVSLAMYYRKMVTYSGPGQDAVRQVLGPLLLKKLTLDRSGLGAGENRFADHFFCVEIDDEELPWDLKQVDF